MRTSVTQKSLIYTLLADKFEGQCMFVHKRLRIFILWLDNVALSATNV